MKWFKSIIGVLCLLSFTSFQQSTCSDKICFDINGINGIIFLNGGDIGLGKLNLERVSVSAAEVMEVDSLANIFVTNKSKGVLPQQGYEDCPIIYKVWKDYKRQIISYREEESGHQIMWIHYIHKDMVERHSNWKDNWVLVSGGCSNYWQTKYNKYTGKFFGFVIN